MIINYQFNKEEGIKMARFNSILARWEAAGTKPPDSTINNGWIAGTKPPADWFNWYFNSTYQALKEIQELAALNADLVSHTGNISNPHKVTKSQLGLSQVDNIKQASLIDFESHVANFENPHAVTKTQLGLSDVENYGVATTEEAIAGIATNKVMTPANVLDSIKEQFKTQEILYEGSAYPGSSTYTFKNAQTISEQNLGIIIIWSDFDKSGSGGTANNYNFDFTFIPKWFISKHAGTNVNVPVATNINTSTVFVTVKTLYITDTSIKGSDLNSTGMYADDVVMRYVIGV
ncbi:hypothetical protein [Listeria monocytogenes]|uniref:hypothetical protein n=2 Tax=Listeria monocytogenes TaxID=1639 RepID=UPI001402D0DE|nr:hypothetical protein [Listeria monocytogenes]